MSKKSSLGKCLEQWWIPEKEGIFSNGDGDGDGDGDGRTVISGCPLC